MLFSKFVSENPTKLDLILADLSEALYGSVFFSSLRSAYSVAFHTWEPFPAGTSSEVLISLRTNKKGLDYSLVMQVITFQIKRYTASESKLILIRELFINLKQKTVNIPAG